VKDAKEEKRMARRNFPAESPCCTMVKAALQSVAELIQHTVGAAVYSALSPE